MPPIKGFNDLRGLNAKLKISVDSSFGPAVLDATGYVEYTSRHVVDIKDLRLLNNYPYFTYIPHMKKNYINGADKETFTYNTRNSFITMVWGYVSIEELNGIKHINRYGADLNNWPLPVLWAYFIRRLHVMASNDKQMLHQVSKMYPIKGTVLQMIAACRTIPQNKPKDTPNPLLKKLFS